MNIPCCIIVGVAVKGEAGDPAVGAFPVLIPFVFDFGIATLKGSVFLFEEGAGLLAAMGKRPLEGASGVVSRLTP